MLEDFDADIRAASDRWEIANRPLIEFLSVAPSARRRGWVVYKQFPGIRGELQGGVLDGFDQVFGEFSVKLPDEF